MAAYSPNDHRLVDHMPQQRLQEALRLGLLARKRVAAERVLAERSVVREGLDGHAATTMVNEIDNIDHDQPKKTRLPASGACPGVTCTYLPALGDATRHIDDTHLATKILPILQLIRVCAVQEVELQLDCIDALLARLLRAPVHVFGELLEVGGELGLGMGHEAGEVIEVAGTGRGYGDTFRASGSRRWSWAAGDVEAGEGDGRRVDWKFVSWNQTEGWPRMRRGWDVLSVAALDFLFLAMIGVRCAEIEVLFLGSSR
jgi:hypothetical protein